MRTKLSWLVVIMLLFCPVSALSDEAPSLWKIVQTLQSKQFVDMTHAFRPVFLIGPDSAMKSV